MKRTTLLTLLLALVCIGASAQRQERGIIPNKMERFELPSILQSSFSTPSFNTRRAGEVIVTPPSGLTTEDYTMKAIYTPDGTSRIDILRNIKVGIMGNDVYLQGMSYYLEDAWIKGTLNDAKTEISFDSPQYYGNSGEYPTYFIYCDISSQQTYPTELKLPYDASTGAITFNNNIAILEGSQFVNDFKCRGFYVAINLTKGSYNKPRPVTPPIGLQTEEYTMKAKNYQDIEIAIPLQIGFSGNEVYVQGLATNLENTWVKGTIADNKATFASGQMMGSLVTSINTIDLYLNYGDADVVFDYEPAAGQFTAQNLSFSINNASQYYEYYANAVIVKVTERVATPATPTITQIYQSSYGDEVIFNVPTVDTNGQGILSSKLSFQFFSDTEKEVQPVVFEAGQSTYPKLTKSMTVIPYGFTDNYDFFRNEIYLNMAHSKWNKIGIQSIYTGGGQEKKSEIFWFTIKEYSGEQTKPEIVAVPEDLTTETYSFTATDPRNSETFMKDVKVGFYGNNEVYIQGLSDYVMDGWVKGTLQNGVLSIPECYLGEFNMLFQMIDVYFKGAEFNFNAETGTFTSTAGFQTMGGSNTYDMCINVTMKKIFEKAVKPGTPTCAFGFSDYGTQYVLKMNIPIVDINGEPMVTDKLSYVVKYQKWFMEYEVTFTPEMYDHLTESMTEIPYNFTDRWDIDNYQIYMINSNIKSNYPDYIAEMKTWQQIGVQSIYRGGGVENRSETGWYNIAAFWQTQGIRSIEADKASGNGAVYNLAGQRVDKPSKGLYIVNGKKVLMK